MEQVHYAGSKRKQTALPLIAFTAIGATAASIALAVVLSGAGKSQGITQLKLPSEVNQQACVSVAKNARLLKTHLNEARLGEYYAAWLEKIEKSNGGKLSRNDLFNAGIAVSVCLK